MKLNNLTYIALFTAILFSSCGKNSKFDCFKRTGNETTEIRSITGFNKIQINGKLDVEFVSSNNHFSISGGENLLPKIETEIIDSTLIIDNENKCNWTRSYKKGKILVSIPINKLNEIEINGLGSVKSIDTINTCNLVINFVTGISDLDLKVKSTNLELVIHDGGGDIVISGISKNVNIYNNGYAYVDLGKLKSNYVFLADKSQNKTFINANMRIDVEIYDVGDVFYTGNPNEINYTPYDTGKLIELE